MDTAARTSPVKTLIVGFQLAGSNSMEEMPSNRSERAAEDYAQHSYPQRELLDNYCVPWKIGQPQEPASSWRRPEESSSMRMR